MSQSYASAGIPLDPVPQDYTPTFTNFTIGDGSIDVARYTGKPGGLVTVEIVVTLGASSSMGTDPQFSLPLTAARVDFAKSGICLLQDSGSAFFPGRVRLISTTFAQLQALLASGTHLSLAQITSTAPFTWTNPDLFEAQITYEAA